MKKSLRIGMMVRSYIPVPRPHDMVYAPIDLMVELAKGLGQRGHQVTIFAAPGSQLSLPNVEVVSYPVPIQVGNQAQFTSLLSDDPELLNHSLHTLPDLYVARAMFAQAAQGQFDLLHLHHPEVALSIAPDFPSTPTLYTLHDPINQLSRQLYQLFASDNQHYISISHHQQSAAPELPFLGTVYNGIECPQVLSTNQPDQDKLLFTGRIIPEKGVKEAIYVAQKARKKLDIIGPIPATSQAYFDQEIKPHLNQSIRYLGRVDRQELAEHYQQAVAILTPAQWDEPFGLTTIEAMANGAPVISLNRGAAPELIINGQTGFIVDSLEEMIQAISKIPTLSRHACQIHVQANFSTDKMVEGYIDVYRRALEIGVGR